MSTTVWTPEPNLSIPMLRDFLDIHCRELDDLTRDLAKHETQAAQLRAQIDQKTILIKNIRDTIRVMERVSSGQSG